MIGCWQPKPQRAILRVVVVGTATSRLRSILAPTSPWLDAELCGRNCCIRFEAKIKSGTLRHEQVRRHLRELDCRTGRLKRVILLTPDDGRSSYITEFLSKYKPKVLHLEWRNVFEYLDKKSARKVMTPLLSELIGLFLKRIEDRVFEQDMAGVITKIAFGEDTEVFPTTKTGVHTGYLDVLPTDKAWRTPRPYKELDGKGRKLLLYDGTANVKAITAEVEIKNVKHIRYARSFPSSNVFAGKPTVYPSPIRLAHIQTIPGLENFGKHRKDRSPYRNITRVQYRKLVRPAETAA